MTATELAPLRKRVGKTGFAPATQESDDLINNVRLKMRPKMVRVAPDKFVPAVRGGSSPDYGFVLWRANGDDTWTPVPLNSNMIRLDHSLAEMLGLPDKQYNTLRRLGDAGFIRLIKISPCVTLIDLDSWFNHLSRCEADPFFWDDEKRFKTYVATFRRVDR